MGEAGSGGRAPNDGAVFRQLVQTSSWPAPTWQDRNSRCRLRHRAKSGRDGSAVQGGRGARRRSQLRESLLCQAAGARARFDQRELRRGRYSRARKHRPHLRHRRLQRRAAPHARSVGGLARVTLAAAPRRIYECGPLQQARARGRHGGACLRCRTRICVAPRTISDEAGRTFWHCPRASLPGDRHTSRFFHHQRVPRHVLSCAGAPDDVARDRGLHRQRAMSNFSASSPDPGVIHGFRTRFPQDNAAADLELWHAYETDNPGIFAGMYQFWIRKNG